LSVLLSALLRNVLDEKAAFLLGVLLHHEVTLDLLIVSLVQELLGVELLGDSNDPFPVARSKPALGPKYS
jgi:hypothetical protein